MGKLKDIQIQKAKSKDKAYKLSDGMGLYLYITKTSKLFRLDYTFENKRYTYSLGAYPMVTLAGARNKALELKTSITNGINPSQLKKDNKNTVKQKKQDEIINDISQIHLIVNEWLEHTSHQVIHQTAKRTKEILFNHFLPHFSKYENGAITSSRLINDIQRKEILDIVTNLSKNKGATAKRLLGYLNRVWLYAINREYTENFITATIKTKDTFKAVEVTHHPKITETVELKELLNAIDNYDNVVIKQALKFVSHIPLRAINLVSLEWSFIDFDKKILTIPRNQMKVKNKNLPPFTVPLTSQVIEILDECKKFKFNEWVFPSFTKENNHISSESGNRALQIMGFRDRQTQHSFRGTFSSLAYQHQDIHKSNDTAIEAVLDHSKGGTVQRAYNHKANYTEQMKPLLAWYSEHLDNIKKGSL